MSRSQRNAALQIPVVFEFRRPGQASGEGSSNGSRHGYGRGRGRRGNIAFESDSLDAAVQASVEQAILDDAVRESVAMAASADSGAGTRSASGDNTPAGYNSFAALENEAVEGETPPPPSRYASAVSGTGPSSLIDSAFPPLPGASSKGKHKPKNQKGPASMAALLGGGGGGGGIRILNSAGSRLPSAASKSRPSSANGESRGGGWSSSNSRPSPVSSDGRPGGWASISPSRTPQVGATRNNQEGSLQRVAPVTGAGPPPPAAVGRGAAVDGFNGSTRAKETSVSGSELGGGVADAVQQLSREELRAGNKSLIESIQGGLRGNELQFADFKDVSGRYNKGEMNTLDYYRHITRLGLAHVVPELGRLCPDPVKGKELIEVHAAQLAREQAFPPVATGSTSVSQPAKPSSGTEKRKGVREGSLQPSRVSPPAPRQSNNEEVEVLSRDGYRTGKGKARLDESSSDTSEVAAEGNPNTNRDRKPQVLVKATRGLLETSLDSANQPASSGLGKGWTCETCTLENQADSPECVACGRDALLGASTIRSGKGADGAGNDKRKKKLSKFQRVRLGDGSAAALLDSISNSNPWGVSSEIGNPAAPATEGRAFGRGVWSNGGGHRLVSNTRRD